MKTLYLVLVFSGLSSCQIKDQNTSVITDFNSKESLVTIPPFYTEKLNIIPDYFQRDRAFGGFPLGGSMYCGPTAASNAIIQLSSHSIVPLYDNTGNLKKDQHALIKKLGSKLFINTDKDGSGPSEICSGLKLYFSECKLENVTIRHFGWRNVSSQFQTVFKKPILDSARLALFRNAAVIVNLGWYEYNKKKQTYSRKGGHWVTMAGYGHNSKVLDSSYIIVHDPETPRRINDYLKLETITNGKLNGKVFGLPVDASGYYRFPSVRGRVGIIDGFIIVELPQKNTLFECTTLNKKLSKDDIPG